MQKISYIEQPDRGAGGMFELLQTDRTFIQRKGKKLSKHPVSKAGIIGFVKEEDMPSETGPFVIYYHQINGIYIYGSVKVDKCTNVLKEDGIVYFESKEYNGKFLLKPYEGAN